MNEIAPESPPEQQSSLSQILRGLADIVETLILSAALFLVINMVTARARVNGSSMEPTLHDGQFVLVNRLAYELGGQPQRGDVVVFYFPRDPQQEYVKRLIGLPDDQILIGQNQVLLNGLTQNEPYIAAAPNYEDQVTVPAEQFYMLGDNRNLSYDSHNWGMVPADYVVGKAILVYWPLSDIHWIQHAAVAPAAP